MRVSLLPRIVPRAIFLTSGGLHRRVGPAITVTVAWPLPRPFHEQAVRNTVLEHGWRKVAILASLPLPITTSDNY